VRHVPAAPATGGDAGAGLTAVRSTA
jgi:hypothetical protein